MAEQRFEARLGDALRAYADRAPVEVDALAIATAAASAAPPRSRWSAVLAGLGTTSRRLAIVLAALLLLLALIVAALVGSELLHPPPPLPPGLLGFTMTGPTTVSRQGRIAVIPLADGRVLVFGGHTPDLGGGFVIPYASAEIFDPKTGRFSPTGSMRSPRLLEGFSRLADGRVLVEGGDPTNGAVASAELFDPVTETWSATGSMETTRRQHTSTALSDGMVLVVGGTDKDGNALADAELYNPADGTFHATGSLPQPVSLSTAVRLANGQVLIAGGLGADQNPVAGAWLYDPTSGAFRPTGSMTLARVGPILTRLLDGQVLILGGTDGTTAELYDPESGTFVPIGSTATAASTATLLRDGRVLVTEDAGTAELYDPPTKSFAATRSENSTARVVGAAPLSDGHVLLIRGGTDPSELFVPDQAAAASASPAPSGPVVTPTPLPDACSLVTSAQIGTIRGVAVGSGDSSSSGDSATGPAVCQWPPASGGDPIAEIDIERDDPGTWDGIAGSPDSSDADLPGRTAVVQGSDRATIYVRASPYIVRIVLANPLDGGSTTSIVAQQEAILELILAGLP